MAQNSVLPRLQLIEFHDQSWYPAMLRSALTEWLRALWEYSKAATVISPILARVLRETGSDRIIDLCSGGSGPMIPVQQLLENAGISVPVLATDKYPDQASMAGLSTKTRGRITGSLESLDATNLPAALTGLRTLFNSFHHFPPTLARQILADAYRNRQPIAIFEITERAPGKVLLSLPASFIGVLLLLTRMRPLAIVLVDSFVGVSGHSVGNRLGRLGLPFTVLHRGGNLCTRGRHGRQLSMGNGPCRRSPRWGTYQLFSGPAHRQLGNWAATHCGHLSASGAGNRLSY